MALTSICCFLYVSASSFLVPIVCSVVGFLGLVLLLVVVIWHNRLMLRKARRHQPHLLAQQRTNNEPEEQHHVTRYRNPLFDTDKGGGSLEEASKVSDITTELLEIDIEKYEKSPKKMNSVRNDNVQRPHSSHMKPTRVKDTNIEVSRTNISPADADVYV